MTTTYGYEYPMWFLSTGSSFKTINKDTKFPNGISFSVTRERNKHLTHRIRKVREVTTVWNNGKNTNISRFYVSDCEGVKYYTTPQAFGWSDPIDFTGTTPVTCFSCLKHP